MAGRPVVSAFEDLEARAVAAAMVDPEYARRLGVEAARRRDDAVEAGESVRAEWWATIAACCSEGLARLERLEREVDAAFALG